MDTGCKRWVDFTLKCGAVMLVVDEQPWHDASVDGQPDGTATDAEPRAHAPPHYWHASNEGVDGGTSVWKLCQWDEGHVNDTLNALFKLETWLQLMKCLWS